jgi:hypothetical protein
VQQGEPQPVATETLHHVAAVDEAQLEQAQRASAAHGERTRIEAADDPSPYSKDDDHADPHPHPYVLHTERPRRQERERRVISWCDPPGRHRDDTQSRVRAGREPEPPRA